MSSETILSHPKLRQMMARYEEIQRQLYDPQVIQDPRKLAELGREQAELEPVVAALQQLQQAVRQIEEDERLVQETDDPELRALAEEELQSRHAQAEALEEQLRRALLPKDPNDEKNVIVEIRAAAGGEEAALFANDLLRMYTRYAERRSWKYELLAESRTELGGIKEATLEITGRGAYSRLKYESGAHRVQRVPVTESGGRIHTSTATVAVMPEAEEVDIEINPDELRIDLFMSSGHGGQSVNTTYSAVRITHLPTGIVVTCQDERSQLKNREKAMRALRAILLKRKQEEQQSHIAQERRSLVGWGERSERIRTYNFPQNRVTDHRINFTTYRLQEVLDGDLDELLDALALADEQLRLKEVQSE